MLDLENLPPGLDRKQASQYLLARYGIRQAPATLAKKACTGDGPAFHLVNKRPLYPQKELDEYAQRHLGRLVKSTSEYARAHAA